MSEKDQGVVRDMCAAGMSLEALYKIYPSFEPEEIRAVYEDYHKQSQSYVEEGITISCNCS